ncbi:MAG: biotin--[acetyl-CoA-carboxylase] ligase [Candidatus Aminicenantes bacterium]|nr:MAG: biotin--[acetyl-CoA-carboxylase] ligase [Candidatus Aminicenantes bacterium]
MEIGAKIHWIKSCPSTNDLAREMAHEGAEEGTVVIADEQTKGRGMKGRSWYSAKKKGFYISCILRPEKANISLIPLLAGLALREAIFEMIGVRVKLKWPNDLVWEKKKLGGILCETGFLGSKANYSILGIGLNISHRSEDFPGDIRASATSLRLITKKDIEKREFLGKLWQALNHWYGLFCRGERGLIVSSFQENSSAPLGKELTLVTQEGEISGVYRGINRDGGLIVEIHGERRSFFSAEIKEIKEE